MVGKLDIKTSKTTSYSKLDIFNYGDILRLKVKERHTTWVNGTEIVLLLSDF